MRARLAARAGLALAGLAALALALAGCGRAATANPAQARLEREDLVAIARVLGKVEPAVDREVAAARAAWPFVLDGLPAHVDRRARERIITAAEAAEQLALPTLTAEREAAALTGPASPLAGRYRDFQQLSGASWRQIAAALQEIEEGPSPGASFDRANVALYIEGVYDANYSLGELGKEIAGAYKALGGAPVLGAVLSEREVQRLAASYTPARDRLTPHEGVKLGS